MLVCPDTVYPKGTPAPPPYAMQFGKSQPYNDANINAYTFVVMSKEGCHTQTGALGAIGAFLGARIDDSGTSWGTEVIITLLVVLALYVCLGAVYNFKAKGASGLELCPHVAFWEELPGLVVDGVRYTIAVIKGCLGRFDQENRDGCWGFSGGGRGGVYASVQRPPGSSAPTSSDRV